MNILHITPGFNYCCGRSKYVYLLCKYFSQLGHNVHLLTDGGDSLKRLDELRVRYTVIKDLHSNNPKNFASNIFKLRNLIKQHSIEIVHINHRKTEFLINTMNIFFDTKIKTVITVLSILNDKWGVEYKTKNIIAVSKAVKSNLLRKFSVNPENISLIPHFIENDADDNTLLESNEKQIVFSAGRFHPEKNYLVLLKAVNLLSEYNLKIILAGEGIELDLYKNFALNNSIDLEILKPTNNLNELFKRARICVLPSVVDPFPHFMLESGIHRRPFIGSDIDGMSELITNEENGLLFKSNNHQELASKIKLFLNNQKLAKKCADNLHSQILTNYSPEKIVKEIENYYYNILSK